MVEETVERSDATNYEVVLDDFMRLYVQDMALPEMVELLCA